MRPLLRHRLLLLRTQRLLPRALQLLRAMLRLLQATLARLLRLPRLLRIRALLRRLRLRAQASKLCSRGARAEFRLQRVSKRTTGQADNTVSRAVGKQKSHELTFVAFLFVSAASCAGLRFHAQCM
jgi:hypothetical protein